MTDIGIDIPINIAKAALIANLWTSGGGFNYTAFGRAYRNVKEAGELVPETYIVGKGSYEDVLTNTNIDALSFFDILPGENPGMRVFTASVDICFAVDLDKLYPLLTDRGEQIETTIMAAIAIIKKTAFRIQGIERGLSSFDNFDRVKPGDNMQPFFLFKFITEVKYQFAENCV